MCMSTCVFTVFLKKDKEEMKKMTGKKWELRLGFWAAVFLF
jgi:hypothetical protein